jgi:hypothetical protein
MEMTLLTREELKQLIADRAEPAVSIFLPTARAGRERQQNPVRLKNLLFRAGRYLEETGMKTDEAEKFLQPVRDLPDREALWDHPADGLAVFLSGKSLRYYRLPVDLPELVTVSTRFHITPLLKLLSGNGRFFLLAFSKHRIRLLEGTHFSVREIELPDLPPSLEEFLNLDSPQKSLQFHTGTAGGSGRRAAVFHGQGSGEEDEKELLKKYFHRIDGEVNRKAAGSEDPLLLAADDQYLSLYREVCSYPHLLEGDLPTNPDRLDEQELHDRAWPIVRPYFLETRRRDEEKYHRLSEKGLAGADVETVLQAAGHGRVEALFAATDRHCWGRYDPDSGETEFFEREEANSVDLIDFAAARTILNGGRVHTVESGEMPADSPLAAIFRYPAG